MTFERTYDYPLIREIFVDLYEYVTDDFAPPPAEFAVNLHPEIWYVLVWHGAKLLGMFTFMPENRICWQAHVAMFRGVSPALTHQAGREIVRWVWEHTPCQRLDASVPVSNKAAVRFGLRAMGLVQYGVNPRSFQKRGRLHDQILMGLSRPG